MCTALLSPMNGSVSFTDTVPGSIATYTCDRGYQMDGVSSRTCEANLTWSGNSPTCTRMRYVYT